MLQRRYACKTHTHTHMHTHTHTHTHARKQNIPSTNTAPVVAAKIGHNVFVLALLHHGNLLLDGCDVIA